MLALHVVVGLVPGMNGYAGVLSVASSVSVQLRVPPLLPWPACTNQSRAHGTLAESVECLTTFCIDIDPSEQVVWLWKSPATYLPGVFAAVATVGAVTTAPAPMAAATASASLFMLKRWFIAIAPWSLTVRRVARSLVRAQPARHSAGQTT